jgi:hypothetical protein
MYPAHNCLSLKVGLMESYFRLEIYDETFHILLALNGHNWQA